VEPGIHHRAHKSLLCLVLVLSKINPVLLPTLNNYKNMFELSCELSELSFEPGHFYDVMSYGKSNSCLSS
jgi:hypothetical protein